MISDRHSGGGRMPLRIGSYLLGIGLMAVTSMAAHASPACVKDPAPLLLQHDFRSAFGGRTNAAKDRELPAWDRPDGRHEHGGACEPGLCEGSRSTAAPA